jgi:uncharacterized protein YggT (Ycf19 family)
MTKTDPTPLNANALALILVKILGLSLILGGLIVMIANVVESLPGFDPNYPGYYFMSELLRPFLAILSGTVLWFSGRCIARRITATRSES